MLAPLLKLTVTLSFAAKVTVTVQSEFASTETMLPFTVQVPLPDVTAAEAT